MTDPKPGFKDTSYRYRAYLAEAVVQHHLTTEGRLLGWDSHEGAVAFHESFAKWPNPPELRKGAGRGGSAYYGNGWLEHIPEHLERKFLTPEMAVAAMASSHYIRLLARERHVLAYTHELAHSVVRHARGDGHNPRWAGAYLILLRRIDPWAAELLQKTFREEGLTIDVEPHILAMLKDVPYAPGLKLKRRRALGAR